MSSNYYQRQDPQPLGRAGEVALVVIGGALTAAAMTALAGLGAACAVFGGGWVWPRGSDTIMGTLGGLLTGHPGRGLGAELAAKVPSRSAAYLGVGAAELLLLVLGVLGAVAWSRYRLPSDTRRGMATRQDVSDVLGVGRLRQARALIRPDLYGSRRTGGRR